jgi:hypothetical protein
MKRYHLRMLLLLIAIIIALGAIAYAIGFMVMIRVGTPVEQYRAFWLGVFPVFATMMALASMFLGASLVVHFAVTHGRGRKATHGPEHSRRREVGPS